jgi:CspA family cold shock protein
MATGSIKTKTDKGFGFISVQGSDDVFFHHSACDGQYDNLQVGDTVTFDMESGPKGPKAGNVKAGQGGDATVKGDDTSDAGAVDHQMAA